MVIGLALLAALAAVPDEPALLIVAPSRFQEALGPFVEHKKTIRPTELVAVEDLLKQADGADDPEKLKRFLFDAWKARKVGYVLLVGDADLMPVRYMVLDRVTAPAFDYAFYPSDLYYADLARADGSFDDWNARKDGFHAGYFGEVRGEKNKDDPINYDAIDYRPDVALGRWPVSDEAQLKTIVAKSIAQEKRILADDHRGARRASFFSVGGWVDSRPLMDRLIDALPEGWTADRAFFGRGDSKPDEAQLVAWMNRGSALVLHAGHGSDTSWEGCASLSGLTSRLDNSDRLPVVMSAGCSTARFATLPPYEAYRDILGKDHKGTNNGEVFDEPPPPPAPYQTGPYNPTGLGEGLLRDGPNGAVAYIGCNTGSQPCGLILMEGFILALKKSPRPRLGDCWSAAVAHYYDRENLARIEPTADWYPASIFFQGMKFMLFGDPSLPID